MSNKVQVRAKLTLELGRVIKGSVISRIKNYAFYRNISVSIDEDKGLIESNFRIALTGKRDDVQAILDNIKFLFEQLNNDEDE